MEGSKLAAAILGEVRRAVVGKDEVLAKVLLAILAGGHILLRNFLCSIHSTGFHVQD